MLVPSYRTPIGQAATREFLTDTVQRSAVFHFHGHCILDRKVLVDQSMELADSLPPVRDCPT